MDCSAVIMVGIADMRPFEARMTFAMARLTVLEMSRVFETNPATNGDRLSRVDFERLAARLSEAGLAWNNPHDAERRLASLRATYEPFLEVLSNYLLLPLPGWLPDRTLRDDWQQGFEGTAATWLLETGRESLQLTKATDNDS
jgi:hypothetical protein